MSHNHQAAKAEILRASTAIDHLFVTLDDSITSYSLQLPVPKHHPRAKTITETLFVVRALNADELPTNSFYLVDSKLKNSFVADFLGEKAHYVNAAEHTLKEVSWLKNYLASYIPKDIETIVGIGGGVLLNAAAYIAEERKSDYIAIPTTVVAAADSSVGGLVRINKVADEHFKKSYYQSVYEPSKIILDPRFLEILPKMQVCLGLSEVVKHGVYQSPALLEYLASNECDPLNNQDTLVKAICWTVALKNIALTNDPDSTKFGGEILRGGHRLAHEIEEKSRFKIPHTQAVAIGVYQDAMRDITKLRLLDAVYKKLDLPRSLQDVTATSVE